MSHLKRPGPSPALKADLLRTLRVGVPLIGAQLLQMGNGLVDTIIAGRIGNAELAAAGIGAGLLFIVSLMCIGLMAGLSPTLSRLIGARRRVYVGRVFRQGLWLALMASGLALLIIVLVRQNLPHFPFAAGLPDLIQDYLLGAAASLPFFALTMAARNVCEATGMTKPVLLVTALGLIINAVASLGLALGWFGLPALGLLGIGLATTIVNIVMTIVLFQLLRGRRFARFELFATVERPQREELMALLTLSIPICFGMLFEAGLFVATSLQMGTIGLLESGAHQIAISASAFCYMLPLGMSFAITARVGRASAQQSMNSVRLRIATALVLMAGMAIFTVTLLLLFRAQIAGLYTDDVELQHFAASLLTLAAIFQLSDGAQVTLIGVLRGLQDTRVPMLINAFSYWVVAFGLGFYAAHVLELGAFGLWAGLIIGLTVATILLAFRLRWKLADMKRLTVATQLG